MRNGRRHLLFSGHWLASHQNRLLSNILYLFLCTYMLVFIDTLISSRYEYRGSCWHPLFCGVLTKRSLTERPSYVLTPTSNHRSVLCFTTSTEP